MTGEWQTVTVEQQGRVVTVRLDRGFRANPLSMLALRELTAVARQLHDCPDVSAVILAGRDDTFCMGMDLKDPELVAARDAGLARRRIALRGGPRLCEAWEAIDALTICAIEGWCVGGGVALAMACDLRVMGSSARLYVPEVERGMNMTWGTVPRLTALIGPARCKRVAALCEHVGADTALDWGLADAVAADGGAVARARQFAAEAARLPPTAMKMVKHDTNVAAHALHRASGHRELEGFALLEQSEDFKEGVASFLERREARFSGN